MISHMPFCVSVDPAANPWQPPAPPEMPSDRRRKWLACPAFVLLTPGFTRLSEFDPHFLIAVQLQTTSHVPLAPLCGMPTNSSVSLVLRRASLYAHHHLSTSHPSSFFLLPSPPISPYLLSLGSFLASVGLHLLHGDLHVVRQSSLPSQTFASSTLRFASSHHLQGGPLETRL